LTLIFVSIILKTTLINNRGVVMPEIPFWVYLVIAILGIAVLVGIIKFLTSVFLKFVLALILILICIAAFYLFANAFVSC